MTEPVWRPSAARIGASNLTAFMRAAESEWGMKFADYAGLHRWSTTEPEKFWQSLWSFGGIVAETRGEAVLADADKMPGARWFPDARLNYAENLLRRRDDRPAILFRGENGERREMTARELYDLASRVAAALRAHGVKPGDRIGAYMPNLPETMAIMLGAVSIGATFSTCSPDFGVQGVLDRFGQIAPRFLFGADGYHYNGETHDSLAKIKDIVAELPSVEKTIVFSHIGGMTDPVGIRNAVRFDEFIGPYPPGEIEFAQLPFNHPLYIVYSSGTTGAPKCMVQGAGGTLLKHVEEHLLQCDITRDDRVFYFTTCGWVMWNWLVGVLATEATILLYDGSPFHPGPETLFDYAEEADMTVFGTSAKFIDALNKAGIAPGETHDLSKLTTMLSTGSPLVAEGFDYVYEKIKSDICLSSMSGGTDLMGCFVGGNPIGPVWRGEIQALCLGMDVDVFDESGQSIREEKGELVCKTPFPSMPIAFWNDDDGSRYRGAYFEKFPGVWTHGDFAEITARDGMIIYGRSDAVLNPGGVRIGTAEIYRQVERIDAVEEALVVGQDWEGDTRLVLFVRLRPGVTLDDAFVQRLKDHIRRNATPRHVPARIVQVADIPRTKSGKIVELAVREVVHGRPVKNLEALANPEALDHFSDRPELNA